MSALAPPEVRIKQEPDGSADEDVDDGHVEQKAETIAEMEARHQTDIEKLHSDRIMLRKQLKETQAANGHLQNQVAGLKVAALNLQSARDAEVKRLKEENEALRAQIGRLKIDRRQRDEREGENRSVVKRKISQRPATDTLPGKPQAPTIPDAELCLQQMVTSSGHQSPQRSLVETTTQNQPARQNAIEVAVIPKKRKTEQYEAKTGTDVSENCSDSQIAAARSLVEQGEWAILSEPLPAGAGNAQFSVNVRVEDNHDFAMPSSYWTKSSFLRRKVAEWNSEGVPTVRLDHVTHAQMERLMAWFRQFDFDRFDRDAVVKVCLNKDRRYYWGTHMGWPIQMYSAHLARVMPGENLWSSLRLFKQLDIPHLYFIGCFELGDELDRGEEDFRSVDYSRDEDTIVDVLRALCGIREKRKWDGLYSNPIRRLHKTNEAFRTFMAKHFERLPSSSILLQKPHRKQLLIRNADDDDDDDDDNDDEDGNVNDD